MLNMKRHTLVLFSFLATGTVSAQEVVSTQGDSYSNTSGSIDFTLGEVIIATGTDGTNNITQGFHQTNWNFLGVEDFSPNYEAIIFPNPTDGHWIRAIFGDSEPPPSDHNRIILKQAATRSAWTP